MSGKESPPTGTAEQRGLLGDAYCLSGNDAHMQECIKLGGSVRMGPDDKAAPGSRHA